MKKFFLFAAACVALVACKNDENVLNNAPQGTPFEAGQYVTISAGMPANGNPSAARKISGTGGSTEITYLWEENDQILVKVGADTAHFVLVDGAGTNSATFAGTMPGSGSTFDIQYPIDAPDLSVQAYKENGLPAGMMSFGATGCSIDAAAELVATTSALKLNLTGSEQISKIVINMVDAVNTEYTLTTDGVTLSSTATPFYLVVNPVTSKVRVTVYAASTAPIDCFTSASIEFVANQCADTQDKEAKLADYICFTALESSTVGPNKWKTTETFSFEWKTNNDNWEELTSASSAKSLNQGDKLYVRAHNANSKVSRSSKSVFTITGNVKVSGNIMALLNSDPGSASISEDCFKNIFNGQTALTDASELILPATTLANSCYMNMFVGCTNLVQAPALPATTLAQTCYVRMFNGCTALVSAPDLPAKNVEQQCCQYMFGECTNLTNAPSIAATTLAQGCFNYMFSGCSALEVAPTLYAETLVESCYSGMFQNCTKLKSVTMLATDISNGNCLANWLKDAGTSVTLPTVPTVYVANNAMVDSIGKWKYLNQYPAIPTGWTVDVKH